MCGICVAGSELGALLGMGTPSPRQSISRAAAASLQHALSNAVPGMPDNAAEPAPGTPKGFKCVFLSRVGAQGRTLYCDGELTHDYFNEYHMHLISSVVQCIERGLRLFPCPKVIRSNSKFKRLVVNSVGVGGGEVSDGSARIAAAPFLLQVLTKNTAVDGEECSFCASMVPVGQGYTLGPPGDVPGEASVEPPRTSQARSSFWALDFHTDSTDFYPVNHCTS
jgi:hypothetical protein